MTLEVPAALEAEIRSVMEAGGYPDEATAIEASLMAWREQSRAIDHWFARMTEEQRAAFLESLEGDDDEFIELPDDFFEKARARVREAEAKRQG